MSSRLRALILTALVGLGGVAAAQPPEARDPLAGKTLAQALRVLEAEGLRIVFSRRLVRPNMRVESEPAGPTPRADLDQVLSAHRLEALEGPEGILVIVPVTRTAAEPRGGAITGFVHSDTGAPLSGATVRVEESGHETETAADGAFWLDRLTPGSWAIEAQADGFVFGRLESVDVAGGATTRVALVLTPTPIIAEEMVVTPSRVSLLRAEPMARIGMSREEILALPHLGEDFFRALTLLPGTLSNDVTAQFHVRGGRRDETQILVDGQELYDAYHLKEQDNAVSMVATGTLSSADLTTGGFSAEYGDRMSGVLDMTTITPTGKTRYRAGIGSLTAQLGGGGLLAGDRGSWLAELRRGTTDYVARLLGDEDPRFWDGFAKLDLDLGERSSLRLNALGSADDLDFEKRVDGELNRLLTGYDSTYVWLTHQRLLSDDLVVDSAASTTSIGRDRRAVELEDDVSFTLDDRRDLDVVELRQDWRLRLGERQRLSWGWRLRSFDTVYDYGSTREFDNPLALIRHDGPEGVRTFRGRFEEDQESVYLTDRRRLGERLTAELGLRFDRHSQTDQSQLTPRLNLALALGERGVARLAWGRYHQSQRPYELQVEDGDNVFQRVERSEHRVLGLEYLLPGAGRRAATSLRAEVYQRHVDDPRRRYENLYEPINSFPELEPDRVLIAAEEARAEGVEVFARGGWDERVSWWANYTWARTEDRVEGRWQPRLFDQRHSLNLDVDLRIADHWRLNVAWRYHTGWPTTPLEVAAEVDDEGETAFVPVLGPINSERLGGYHRMDLRASRRWTLGSTELSAYLDIQNVYDRENDGGFDISIDEDDGSIESVVEAWPGILPSIGVRVEF